MNNFDKFTLGNAPAAIYMIDLLNNIDRKKSVYIIKSYGEFKETFRELSDAHDDGAISARVLRKYIETYRLTLPGVRKNLEEKQYDIKIINLYENLIIAEFKKVIRRLDAMKKIEISAIARAKSKIKNSGRQIKNESITTYGRYEGNEVKIDVKFNQNGLGSSSVNANMVQDRITSETLMEKSLKRLERRKLK